MGNVEIPKWLEGLPLAPEFRPTDTEFADPIAYISKIEKEASVFGICKIVPPLPKPSKKYVFSNLNKSLAKCPELGDDGNLTNEPSSLKVGSGDRGNDVDVRAVFTTRHQELGQCSKRVKGVDKENLQLGFQKQVWQSGEVYTLEQFEAKSKAFAKSVLGMIKDVNPLVVEALFWKAASEKPIYVEYANDVPGSAFGEPEGQYRYFRRRRRKRASYQSYRRFGQNFDCKNKEKSINDSHHNEARGGVPVPIMNQPSTSSEMTYGSPINFSTSFSEEGTKPSTRKSENDVSDVEGTAGWKLSNSPWNLQVIARSPGSLTRFMPDDIPGVTSPMVYVGMLFSWFAWHVEDHELHSMNFLHTGSPKTWYAVPGDYAFAFEEVIQTEAYGGNIDRLAALSLLGEKTTLLSPELIISSGIPCCRLIQNPGEFVITFPRAYHVGFSHGFNCGEAANFGTSQWIKVAKEAAVRRAAMNYLPMLSHQQLLYLLTMSFVSRIPRSLLPGARSSRLRDRLKEERELSVKKAFMEDMLTENNILSAFLGKYSTCRVVIWNPDLLPRANKEADLTSPTTKSVTSLGENVSRVDSEYDRNNNENDLLKEMTLYMETLNDLYLDDDDDLSSDFQVDSGTLVCVACGILCFPFICVVQPTERTYMELMPVDHIPVEDAATTTSEFCHSNSDPIGSIQGSVSGDPPCANGLDRDVKNLPVPRGWNAASKFVRPRTFCLEHGSQIQELMQASGGVNMLIICHSDYQKIKAHAAVIAEEIRSPFNFDKIPFENASQEDLNLIDLAIDDEDHDECGIDWTSKMGINLRYCVKARKNSASKPVRHAFELGGLFSERSPSANILTVKWKSRRSRTRIKLREHGDGIETKADEVLHKKSDVNTLKKEDKLIQYARRSYKVRIDSCLSDGQGCLGNCLGHKHPVFRSEESMKNVGDTSVSEATEITEGGSEGLDFFSLEMSETLYEVPVLEATGNSILGDAIQAVCSQIATGMGVETVEGQIENQLTEESNSKENETVRVACSTYEINAGEGAILNTCCSEALVVSPPDERFKTQRVDQMTEDVEIMRRIGHMDSERHQTIEANRDTSIDEVSDSGRPASLRVDPATRKMDNIVEKESFPVSEGCNRVNLDDDEKQLEDRSRNHDGNHALCNGKQVDKPMGSLSESCDPLKEALDGEDKLQKELLCGIPRKDVIPTNSKLTNSMTASLKDGSEIPGDRYSDGQLAAQITNEIIEELVSHAITHAEMDQPTPSTSGETFLAFRETSAEERLCCNSTRVSTEMPLEVEESCGRGDMLENNELILSHEPETTVSLVADHVTSDGKGRKRKNEFEQMRENRFTSSGFVKSPCERLRPRAVKDAAARTEVYKSFDESLSTRKRKKPSDAPVPCAKKKEIAKRPHKCDMEGCHMSFETKAELQLHKRNRCPYEGCRKRFSSHKYAIVHQRVHEDDRPLKCPWKGCSMSFKWAWARTEHIRVHTGEKPYQCKVEGCGRSFRFVSDFSRHRRKTGHYAETSS